MKKLTKNKLMQKIILGLVTILTINFITPNYTYAGFWGDVGTDLLKEIAQLVGAIGDVVMGIMNKYMLGTTDITSSMLSKNDINLISEDSWLYATSSDFNSSKPGNILVDVDDLNSKGLFDVTDWSIPNMLYSPEYIFSNRIAMLDVNFISPSHYSSAVLNHDDPESIANQLRPTIAKWYNGFRNIAIVVLLSVLVYLGIRIIISSTAVDKAKFKESLKNWFIALVLIFTMQFIMAGTLMLVEQFTNLFAQDIDDGILIQVAGYSNPGSGGGDLTFRTNLIGLVRFMAQSDTWQDATAYIIMYLALIIYTIIFTFQYLKRVLWMAFLTMISPLVAMTYPIDKIADGRSQAFNLWFKEYLMNAIIQPVHLLLYTTLLGSSINLAAENQLYAIVALLFLVPAEKFIKKLFGLSADTADGFGSFAGGALTMSALQALSKDRIHKPVKGRGNNSKDSDSDNDSTTPRTKPPGISSFNGSNLTGVLPGAGAAGAGGAGVGAAGAGAAGAGAAGGAVAGLAGVAGPAALAVGAANAANAVGNVANSAIDAAGRAINPGMGTVTDDTSINESGIGNMPWGSLINGNDMRDDSLNTYTNQNWNSGLEDDDGDFSDAIAEYGYGRYDPNMLQPENPTLEENDDMGLLGDYSGDNNWTQIGVEDMPDGVDAADVQDIDSFALPDARYTNSFPGTEPNLELPEEPPAEEEPTMRRKIAGFATATASLAKRKHLGRFTGNIMKSVARGTLKAAGAGMGAMIGLGAGITTGDFSKAAQYMATGAVAGGMIGSNVYKAGSMVGSGAMNLAQGIKNSDGRFTYDYRAAVRGEEYAEERRKEEETEKARKKFMDNDNNVYKYRQMTARINESNRKAGINRRYSTEEVMRGAFDYSTRGFKDDDIEKGLTMEAAHGGIGTDNRNDMMAIMNLKNKYGSEYITDANKAAQFDKVVSTQLGSNQQAKEQVKALFEEAHGLKGYHLQRQNQNVTQAQNENVNGATVVETGNTLDSGSAQQQRTTRVGQQISSGGTQPQVNNQPSNADRQQNQTGNTPTDTSRQPVVDQATPQPQRGTRRGRPSNSSQTPQGRPTNRPTRSTSRPTNRPPRPIRGGTSSDISNDNSDLS